MIPKHHSRLLDRLYNYSMVWPLTCPYEWLNCMYRCPVTFAMGITLLPMTHYVTGVLGGVACREISYSQSSTLFNVSPSVISQRRRSISSHHPVPTHEHARETPAHSRSPKVPSPPTIPLPHLTLIFAVVPRSLRRANSHHARLSTHSRPVQ